MDVDVLWQLTRSAFNLPEKPLWGSACNRCGLCCLVETCPLGLMFFGDKAGTCPALKLGGGQSHCQLIAQPDAVLPALIAAEAQEMALIMLGSGMGCDSELTDADTAAIERGVGTPMPSEQDRTRARQLLDAITAKLEAV